MELVALVSLCVLTRCGTTFAAEHGPAVTHLVVKEGNDAVLPCSLSTTSIKQELFDWKKDGQREVFMYDRGSIYDEKRSGQDEHFKGGSDLKTKTDPRCSSKTIFHYTGETQDGVQLQCEVHGASPKPVVQWQDRAGNIIPAKEPQVSERGGSYDISSKLLCPRLTTIAVWPHRR
ncbi:hypothetical protein INR49_002414, partial [Caranx melampygus]